MKVLLLNSVCYGSTGKISADIARLVRARGDDALLLYGRGEAPTDINVVRVEGKAEVALHVAKTRLFDRTGFGSYRATKRLIAEAERFDPDVIHLHNLHGYWVHVGLLFDWLKRAGKPVVWTFHDCWPFTGHCPWFDLAACERWKTGCGACRYRNYPARWGFDASRRNFRDKARMFCGVPNLTVVTPSRWLAGLVSESFLSGYPVRVLPNGIDLSVFRPTPSDLRKRYGVGDDKLVLGVANVWEPRKNLPAFFELQRLLPAGWRIAIVGLTEAQVKALPAGIVGVTRTANAEELAAWYTAADVFCDPTLEENFPTTHLEALACGTPVATYASGGSAEMLTENCGAWVKTGDLPGLAAAILQAAALQREDCVRQAQHYDGKKCLGAYPELYAELLHENATRSGGEARI